MKICQALQIIWEMQIEIQLIFYQTGKDQTVWKLSTFVTMQEKLSFYFCW